MRIHISVDHGGAKAVARDIYLMNTLAYDILINGLNQSSKLVVVSLCERPIGHIRCKVGRRVRWTKVCPTKRSHERLRRPTNECRRIAVSEFRGRKREAGKSLRS